MAKKKYNQLSLKLHQEKKGKIELKSKVNIQTKDDLSIAYTPGVAEPCKKIAKDKSLAYKYTIKANTIAIVSDGSAVLGLGNIGAEASLPVMEGKALIFKEFADVDAYPIVLKTQDTEEIIQTVKNIAPTFGGINLEDIKAPKCFEIEQRLIDDLDIPVMHDDQHGTAIVVLAGLINALKLVNKNKEEIKIVLSGAGAAGIAITKLLMDFGCKNVILCDSKGIIDQNRNDLNKIKTEMLNTTNKKNISGSLSDAMNNSDVFIGISAANIVTEKMVASMNEKSIVFAMANPTPEIMPHLAKNAGAHIVATGRSDFPNQINNSLAFPGMFRGALDSRVKKFTTKMKLEAAKAIAKQVKDLNPENIIPSTLDKSVAKAVAEVIRECSQ